jgi:Fur family zinc uptake transcriptional regulator
MEIDSALTLTKNQQLVWDVLRASDMPLSAYAVLDRIVDSKVRAPLQVYRALDKLIAYGLVHRLESLNAFVVCSHRHEGADRSTGFAICEKCGQVEEFSQPAIGRGLARWSKAQAFVARTATIELRGLCKDCGSNTK